MAHITKVKARDQMRNLTTGGETSMQVNTISEDSEDQMGQESSLHLFPSILDHFL